MKTKRTQAKNKSLLNSINIYYMMMLIFFIISIMFVYVNKHYLLSGADFGFHRLRLLGLVQSIEHGVFFPKINYIMAGGLGYGVPMFYGQWFLYWPALLMSIFKFTFIQSWLSLYIIYYTSMLFLNFSIGKKFLMNTIRSTIFSLLLVFNPLITSIVNGDLPFAICLMLTPSLFYCIWRIMYFEENYFVFLAILVAIIFNTHIISTFVIVLIGVLWLLMNLKKLTLHQLVIFTKSILLFFVLSANYWMPLLEQISAQNLKGMGLTDAFRFNSVHGLGTIFINSFNDSIASITRYPTISIVGLLLYLISMILYNKSDELNKKYFLLISFLLVFSSSLFPWALFSHTPLGSVQFVGRYLVFTTVLIILSSAQNKNISTSLLLFLLFLTFSSTISQQVLPNLANEDILKEYNNGELYIKEEQKYKELNDVNDLLEGSKQVSGVAGGEYLNASADLSLKNDGLIDSESAKVFNIEKSYDSITFDYTLDKNKERAKIIVPFIWYKGYTADYSNNAKGSQPSLNYDLNTGKVNDDGRLSIEVERSGRVHIYYRKTLIQRISFIISFVSWLALIFFLIKNKLK